MNQYLLKAIERNQENGYLLYHAPRYDVLLSILHKYHSGNGNILDIGRSPFSKIACESLNAQIDTLGFDIDQKTETGVNYYFDLNRSQDQKGWRIDIPKYDVIVLAEVIEHLFTSPRLVLLFLRSILKDDGILVIQTPNAVVLHKRIQMLIGLNPYSLISENPGNPSHFREYTAAEIVNYCAQAGFAIEDISIQNYFDYRYTDHVGKVCVRRSFNRLINIAYDLLPSSLRAGLCFVVRPA
jgi:SAM-dependent methyltransferase